jgi:type II secretory pathway component PulF
MVVCVFGIIVGVMGVRMVMRVVVLPRAVAVFVGMDDDLPGRIAAAAILAADQAGSLAFRAFPAGFGDGFVFCHNRLPSPR